MLKSSNAQYLKNEQYRDSSNLDVRVLIHQRFSTNTYGWFKWVFDKLMKLPGNARLLELGCGNGLLWKENASRIPAGWQITLSDFSPGMLDAAWRNLVVTGRAFRFQEIDAQSVPYQPESFEAVIANHMLYHVPDRARAIAEIQRVLKPGGRLFATTVGRDHLKEMMAWYRQVHISKTWESLTNPFILENGLEQLTPFFSDVQIARYEDDLCVSELEPIMAYIRSGIRVLELSESELANLQQELQKELDEKGCIFITKDAGLFEAIK